MNRKSFLQTLGTLSAGMTLPLNRTTAAPTSKDEYLSPPYLQPGDTIGITAPAGHITTEEIAPAVQVLQSWGYTVQVGTTIGKRDFTFGGTDKERKEDLQAMLDNPAIKAIMCARGGYGVVRIVDDLEWKNFKKAPKWVIGFSDVTVLHSHIHGQCRIATLHSKMTNSFPDNWSKAEPVQVETILSIKDALEGKKLKYPASPNMQNKPGVGEGILVGGNLRTLETLAGTPSDIQTAGKILFVEDTGEYLYSIDRMFWHLKRTGKLRDLKGLAVGGFKVKKDEDEEPFGKIVQEIVLEKVASYNYPVLFDFPVGHQRNNHALKCGVRHRLQVSAAEAVLLEP